MTQLSGLQLEEVIKSMLALVEKNDSSLNYFHDKSDKLVKAKIISGQEVVLSGTLIVEAVFKIIDQFYQVNLNLKRISKKDSFIRASNDLEKVSIRDPERILESYPFQLSGGLAQRVVITMAMINKPELLLADEPSTALDVTIQKQALDVMHE